MCFKRLAPYLLLLNVFMASKVFAGIWHIQGDLHCRDPSIYFEDGLWYAFCTGPGIQVLRSEDGVNWVRAPQIFSKKLPWWSNIVPKHTNLNVWAPDVEHFKGRIWLFYSISTLGSKTSAIGLASTSSISTNKWGEDGLVIQSADDYNAIDPNLIVDKDGSPWLAFGSYWGGIKIVALDPSDMRPTGSIYDIATRSNSTAIEGPCITYRSGYYYLFASIDKSGTIENSTYKIVYSRSVEINGPYYDREGNPAMETGGTILDAGDCRWIGPGGEDVYGNVIARHAYDVKDNGTAKLLIGDLHWTKDGWPTY